MLGPKLYWNQQKRSSRWSSQVYPKHNHWKKFRIPYTDFKMKINEYILQQRWQRWNSNKQNKLLEIKHTLGGWKQSYRKNRKEEVILSRLYIGHTRTTHSFLLKTKQQLTCHACQTEYTVKHILIECTSLTHIRETIYSVNDMKVLGFYTLGIKRNQYTVAQDMTRKKEQDNNLVEKKGLYLDKEIKKRRIIVKRGVFCRLNYSICLGNSSFSSM